MKERSASLVHNPALFGQDGAVGDRRGLAYANGRFEKGLRPEVVLRVALRQGEGGGGGWKPSRALTGRFLWRDGVARRIAATVRAKEPVQVMVFEPTYFRPLLIENPSAAVTLLEGVFGRLIAA